MFSKEEINQAGKTFGLSTKIVDEMLRSARTSSIRLVLGSTAASLGFSKWGGAPDLPPSFEWPIGDGEPFWFVCQLKLADLKNFRIPTRLPDSGIISIFIDRWGEGKDGVRVEYFDQHSDLSPVLVKTSNPLAERSQAIHFEQEFLFPDPSDLLWCLNQDQWIRYMDFFKQIHLRPPLSPFEHSRLFVPRIHGYNQVDYTFNCLFDSVLEVTRRKSDQLLEGELGLWGLLAHLEIPSLRSQLVFTKCDNQGTFIPKDCYLRAGES